MMSLVFVGTATRIDCHPCHRTDRFRGRPEMGLLPLKGKQCVLKSQNNAIDTMHSFVLNKFQVSQSTGAYFASKQTSLYCRVSLLLQFLSVYFASQASFVLLNRLVAQPHGRGTGNAPSRDAAQCIFGIRTVQMAAAAELKDLLISHCILTYDHQCRLHSGTVPDDDALCMLNSCYSISLRASVSVGYSLSSELILIILYGMEWNSFDHISIYCVILCLFAMAMALKFSWKQTRANVHFHHAFDGCSSMRSWF